MARPTSTRKGLVNCAYKPKSRPQTPPSHEEKRSGEPSRIPWACTRFCDNVTQQRSKHFAANPIKIGTDARIEMNKFLPL